MKRFRPFNFIVTIVWALSIIVLLGIAIYHRSDDEDIHTRRFCAYGQVYVEFEHDNKIWGTTYLGVSGKPITCNINEALPDSVSATPTHKEVI